MSLNLHIVTPSRNMLSVTCEDVVLPGYDGEMGVLPEHAQFINRLGAGVIEIRGAKSNAPTRLAIAGGVAEIAENKITVLANDAVFPSEVNSEKLEEEQRKLSIELVSLSEDATDRDRLFERQRWLQAQRDVIGKSH